MIAEKYLPLGTVLMLRDGKKRVMVVGYCTMDMAKKTKICDYIGCFYPEGIFTLDKILAFNHKDVEKIYHMGFTDAEDVEFKKRLKVLMNGVTDNNGDLIISPDKLSANNNL